jgi:hypothetical protein
LNFLVLGLLSFITLWNVNLFANLLLCANFLDSELRNSATKTQQHLNGILNKLNQLFGPRWQEANNNYDHYSAQLILNQLTRFGTPVDIEIFDTYVSILLNTQGPFELREQGLFYIDQHLGERPKSTHFRELHWDWSIFIGYFSTTPSVLHFTKAEDLAYLQELLNQINQQKLLKQTKLTLSEVLMRANRSWHFRHLQKTEPQLAKTFKSYFTQALPTEMPPEVQAEVQTEIRLTQPTEQPTLTAKSTYTLRYFLFAKKVEAFKVKSQIKKHDAELNKKLDEALSYFKNSHSELDLYIFEKYFDLILQLPVSEALAQAQTDKKLQLTHWQVFYHGLPFGSVEYFTDFLFQNSHDTAMKAHLLKILMTMQDLVDRNYLEEIHDPKNAFFSTFTLARTYVENDIEQIPAAKIYESDLRIFTVNADLAVSTKSQGSSMPRFAFPRYDEVLVSWNPFVSKLQANVIRSYSLQSENTPKVGGLKKLRDYFKMYFDTLRQNQTVPDEWINEFEREEMDSSLARSTIFAFTETHTEKLLALVRIFDGSQMEFYDSQDQWRYDHDDKRLPIKQAFPAISLPELQNFEHVLEIGRVLATKDIIANSYDTMMARIADYFNVRGMKGIIYLSSPAAMARYNQRKGASVVYTPEQLAKNPQDMNSVYILKITIDDFIKKFLRPEYDSVQLRETPH